MELFDQFVNNWGAYLGVAVAFVVAFERLAQVTETKKDDKIVAKVRMFLNFLALKKDGGAK